MYISTSSSTYGIHTRLGCTGLQCDKYKFNICSVHNLSHINIHLLQHLKIQSSLKHAVCHAKDSVKTSGLLDWSY